MSYRYEIQQRQQYTRARGQGAEGRGGRNCGTYHGEKWVQRGVSNDKQAALRAIIGMGEDWRVLDNETDETLSPCGTPPTPKEHPPMPHSRDGGA